MSEVLNYTLFAITLKYPSSPTLNAIYVFTTVRFFNPSEEDK